MKMGRSGKREEGEGKGMKERGRDRGDTPRFLLTTPRYEILEQHWLGLVIRMNRHGIPQQTLYCRRFRN